MEKKWQVFPLTMFYVFAVACLAFRVYDCIFLAKLALDMNIVGLLVPPMLKISIGLVQIVVMVELTIRVKQGIEMLVQANESSIIVQSELMMSEIMSKQVKFERFILVIRLVVVVLCASSLTWSLVIFSQKMKEDSWKRIEFLVDTTKNLAWTFLALFVLLASTSGLLIWKLTRQF